jgi:hypothetical protein
MISAKRLGIAMIIVWLLALFFILVTPNTSRPETITRVEDTRGNLIYIIKCDDYGYCTVYDVTDHLAPKYKIKKDKIYDMKGNPQGEID